MWPFLIDGIYKSGVESVSINLLLRIGKQSRYVLFLGRQRVLKVSGLKSRPCNSVKSCNLEHHSFRCNGKQSRYGLALSVVVSNGEMMLLLKMSRLNVSIGSWDEKPLKYTILVLEVMYIESLWLKVRRVPPEREAKQVQ